MEGQLEVFTRAGGKGWNGSRTAVSFGMGGAIIKHDIIVSTVALIFNVEVAEIDNYFFARESNNSGSTVSTCSIVAWIVG